MKAAVLALAIAGAGVMTAVGGLLTIMGGANPWAFLFMSMTAALVAVLGASRVYGGKKRQRRLGGLLLILAGILTAPNLILFTLGGTNFILAGALALLGGVR